MKCRGREHALSYLVVFASSRRIFGFFFGPPNSLVQKEEEAGFTFAFAALPPGCAAGGTEGFDVARFFAGRAFFAGAFSFFTAGDFFEALRSF